MRALGLVALVAFVSIWRQIEGLFGRNGIAPAVEQLALLRTAARVEGIGLDLYRLVPTLMWAWPRDAALHTLCAAGSVASVALVADIAPAAALGVIWSAYLSIVSVGGVLMGYQWDGLLLESCALALFVAPWRLRPRWRATAPDAPPTRASIALMRVLLFKLMLLSGLVKLTSGDPSWRALSALDYHYWTQPIPSWASWYEAQLPHWAHAVEAAVMFAIEVALPLLVFAPRRLRHVAFVGFLVLQIAIAATGTYGFFNALTIALTLTLLDDAALIRLPRLTRFGNGWLRPGGDSLDAKLPRSRARFFRRWGAIAAAVVCVAPMFASLARTGAVASPVRRLLQWLAPLRTVNAYGLFATMTTSRPEIILEGSADGESWKPYAFRWKPGALGRRPRFALLHMPRLDWQLWFAALAGRCDRAPWYPMFVRRLLEGSPPVVELLASDPFPLRPPAFVRSTLYEYRFTTAEERRATGDWWARTRVGPYCHTLALQDGELVAVDLAGAANPVR